MILQIDQPDFVTLQSAIEEFEGKRELVGYQKAFKNLKNIEAFTFEIHPGPGCCIVAVIWGDELQYTNISLTPKDGFNEVKSERSISSVDELYFEHV